MSGLIHENDIEFIWEDDGSESIFSDIGQKCSNLANKSNDIKLDVFLTFKKTTLNSVVDYLFFHLENKAKNRLIKESINLVKCIVLYALSPGNADVYFSDIDEFREITKIINKEYGEYYLTSESLSQIHNSETLIQRMVAKKLLEKEGNRYYIVGHILKNIEINKTNKKI